MSVIKRSNDSQALSREGEEFVREAEGMSQLISEWRFSGELFADEIFGVHGEQCIKGLDDFRRRWRSKVKEISNESEAFLIGGTILDLGGSLCSLQALSTLSGIDSNERRLSEVSGRSKSSLNYSNETERALSQIEGFLSLAVGVLRGERSLGV